MANMLLGLERLGGSRLLDADIRSELDLVDQVERGLPAEVADRLARLGDLSETELALVIPRRTLSHARRLGRFSSDQSDRILRTAALYARAHDVFASAVKANHWMRRPSRALEGKIPLSLLRTSSGAELVDSMLDRIAYGVYS